MKQPVQKGKQLFFPLKMRAERQLISPPFRLCAAKYERARRYLSISDLTRSFVCCDMRFEEVYFGR